MNEPKEANGKEVGSPGVVPLPSSREALEIEAARTRQEARRRPVRTRVHSKSYGSRSFASPHADHAGFRARLADALGTVSGEFTEASMHQLIKAVSHCDAREGGAELELNAALALIQSIRPTTEVEAALALQAAASHRLAMELLARVRRGKSWPRKSAQEDRWSFCLTAGTLCPANQEIP